MAKVIFVKSSTFIGLVVRIFTRSKWDHAIIQIGDFFYEATSHSGVIKHYGNYNQLSDIVEKEIIEVKVPELIESYNFLEAQLDKPYDWKAVFAWPFRLNWHDRSKWFCTELIAEALIVGGVQGINEKVRRIEPKKLYKMLKRIQ